MNPKRPPRLSTLLTTILAITSSVYTLADEPGFVSLFNGRDLTGWVVMGSPEGWTVADGTLHSEGGKGGVGILTDRQFSNFILRMDWMLSTVGNSGIFIRAGEKDVGPGFEVQLLAPWTPYRDDMHCTGSLYGHVAPSPRPDETTNRWRTIEITCRYREITVSIDGQTCTHADMAQVSSLQGVPLSGHIGMQDSHTGPGEWVKFRNLRLKDLDEGPAFVVEGLRSSDVAVRRHATDSAVRLGAPMVGPLLSLYAEDDVALRRTAQETIFTLVAESTAPGADKRAAEVGTALVSELKSNSSTRSRAYAAELLGIAGGGKEAVSRLAEALFDDEMAGAALAALQRIPGAEATAALVGSLANASEDQKVRIIVALGARRDRSAVKQLLPLARKRSEVVRPAALRALGQIGDPSAVPVVKSACSAKSPGVCKAAVEAVLSFAEGAQHGDKTRSIRLYRLALKQGANKGQKAAALLGLKERGASGLLSTCLTVLRDAQASETALQLLRGMEGKQVEPAVMARLKAARGLDRAMLLRLGVERGFPGLLPELERSARGGDEPARVAALELLAKRGDSRHADLFLEAAKRGSHGGRSAAVVGYVTVAESLAQKKEDARARAMFLAVLNLAVEDTAKRRALAGLATVADADCLTRVAPFLEQKAVREEAAKAYLAAADSLAAGGKKEEAVEAYLRVLRLSPPPKAASAAAEKLRALGVNRDVASEQGFVTNWWLLGPFPNPQQSAYEKPFSPETEVVLEKEVDIAGQSLRWKPHHETASLLGIVELSEVLSPATDVACYGYAEVASDREQEILLKIGSDDGMAVWLNGQRIGGNPALRALTVDQDVVKARFVAGTNRILLKILQGGSRWAFCLRITDADGKPLVLRQREAK